MINPDDSEVVAPSLIAEMYGRWTLDCIVELANAVALDFVTRPRHYRPVPESVAGTLAQFKSLTGKHPNWPDTAQRAAIYIALLGASDATSGGGRSAQFHQASAALREAAKAFSERVYDTGVAMLRQSFRDRVVTLRAYLNTLEGRVVALGHSQTSAIFTQAKTVLSNKEVAGVFGLPPAPVGDWPLSGDFSGDGAYLVEEIARALQPETVGSLSERQFIVMQRIADYGKRTIEGVLDDSTGWETESRIDALIQNTYSWMTAIRDLGI